MGEIVREDGPEQESTMEKMFHSLVGCLWNYFGFWTICGGVFVSAGECVESDANRCAFGNCFGSDGKQEETSCGLLRCCVWNDYFDLVVALGVGRNAGR